MHKARKLFRLFKTFNELGLIRNHIKSHANDEFGHSFSILSRLGYFAYWACDNVDTLMDLKIIKSVNRDLIVKSGLKLKIIGLLFGLLLAFRNWIHAAHK